MPAPLTPPEKVRQLAYHFIRPYLLPALGALLALTFTAGITLSLGQGLRLLIDQGFATGSPAMLNRSLAIFALLVAGLAVGTFARFYLVSWIGERVVTDIRQQVFNHLIALQPGFFAANRSREIQSRLTADTTVLQSVLGSTLSIALRNALMLAGGVVLLFITNAKLTAIVILAIPLVLVPILFFGRRVRRLSRQSQDRLADVGSYIGEILTEIKTVQAYNHQALDQQSFAAVCEQAFAVARQRIRQRAWLTAIVILLVLGAIGVMLWVGGMDVMAGRISAGELAAFVFYSLIVGVSAGALSEVAGELQRAAGASSRIIELLQSRPEVSSPANPVPLPAPVSGQITLDQVSFAYPGREQQPAIRAITLDIHAGETLALVGPSGAGKSTLFELLLRFQDPQQGHIRLDGKDVRQLDLGALRSCFALVAQQPGLFHASIADNIRYSRPQATDKEVVAAAQAAHADDFIRQLPQGYQTRLGDAGLGLSGGQKQRLAIARALLSTAPILLLDEATSALDAESEHLIQQALPQLMQGRTTLVIAHRLATVRDADRIAVMDQGRLIGLGSHQQLLTSNPLYARLAALQFTDQSPD